VAWLLEAWPWEGVGSCAIGRFFNRPNKGFSPQYAFSRDLGSRQEMESRRPACWKRGYCHPMKARTVWGSNNSPGLSRIATAEFTAQYPLAHLQFKDPGIPVKIELDAFFPFHSA
jgi:hypothetical protein